MIKKIEIEQLENLLSQIITLSKDYEELRAMEKDTTLVEEEIQARVRHLRVKARDLVENSLDIPALLDGELLIYEKSIKRRKYINEKTPQEVLDMVDVKSDGHGEFYFYMDREVYRLDVEEANLMAAIRFINFKQEYPLEKLPAIIEALRTVARTSYGYRLTLASSNNDVIDGEDIYTGTVFNNSLYSKRSYALLEKLLLKLKDDYIERTNSSYSTLDYIVQHAEKLWLIINIKNGATDVLTEDEEKICRAAFDLKECFNEKNILANDRKTDEMIERLQVVVIHFLEKKNQTKTV
jgi:hypothetical protein